MTLAVVEISGDGDDGWVIFSPSFDSASALSLPK